MDYSRVHHDFCGRVPGIVPKPAETRLSVGAQTAGWAISFAFGLWSIFGLWPALNGYDWMLYHYVFCGTHRLLFALAIAWLMYACHTGHASLIDRCLSASWLVPMANVGLGTYLFNVFGISGANIMAGYFRTWTGHLSYSGLLLFAILISYVVGGLKTALLVELPATNFERIFLTNSSSPSTKKQRLKKNTDAITGATKEQTTMLSDTDIDK